MTEDGRSIDEVNDYYDESYLDYVLVWGTAFHRQMHFGYHDTDSLPRRWLRFYDAVENVNRVLADETDVGRGDRVLDAGCGVGGSTDWLARERSAEAVGVNLNPRHLDVARRRSDEAAEFALMDFTDTGFADDSFDVVWAIEAAGHADDTSEFVDEAHRVLRPGGRLAVVDGYLSRPHDELEGEAARRVEAIASGLAWRNPDSVDEMESYLRDAGFADVEFEDQYERVRPSALLLYLTTLFATPFAWTLERLGLRTEVQRRNRVAARHQYPALRDGVVVHGLYTATKP
ncbi:MAG: class I SAM-dependent methyltransferase [Halobacteriales archaeon]